jgi:hypothetical protein
MVELLANFRCKNREVSIPLFNRPMNGLIGVLLFGGQSRRRGKEAGASFKILVMTAQIVVLIQAFKRTTFGNSGSSISSGSQPEYFILRKTSEMPSCVARKGLSARYSQGSRHVKPNNISATSHLSERPPPEWRRYLKAYRFAQKKSFSRPID